MRSNVLTALLILLAVPASSTPVATWTPERSAGIEIVTAVSREIGR